MTTFQRSFLAVLLALLILPGLPHPYYPVKMTVTSYAPLDEAAIAGMCHDGNPWSTSTGGTPGPGTVAVNPAVIPYGTVMYIQGYGEGVADDTGGMIRARVDLIDVFFWTRAEAFHWGNPEVTVWLPLN